MKTRKSEQEIDEMQKSWANRPCEHNKGYGYEWNEKLGCVTDYFCLQCGYRNYSADFFEKMEKEES